MLKEIKLTSVQLALIQKALNKVDLKDPDFDSLVVDPDHHFETETESKELKDIIEMIDSVLNDDSETVHCFFA